MNCACLPTFPLRSTAVHRAPSATSAIGQLPAPVQQSWQSEWASAYEKLELWPRYAIDPLGQ